jgi:spore coat protein H
MKNRFYIAICFLILNIQASFAQNPGDSLFNSPVIHDINITFTQPNFWDSLMYYKMYADSFNLSTQSIMGNVIIDGDLVDSVGISLKGNSSFGYPGQKKPIKIELNEYVLGKKYDRLKTLNLNNNMLDPTMMREKLLLDFMNSKGMPAPRCTYARVSYNGQYVGLYKLVEVVDKQFIKTHFNDWGGNLFKGDPLGTLNWIDNNNASYYPYYELHSNNLINDWSDLVNLIDNINNTPSPDFYDTLETNLNTTTCIQQWAARNLFADLDGYFHSPHNYYLYHDSLTDKFQWCSWDVSVAFGFYPFWFGDSTEKVSVLDASTILAQRMLADPTYRTTYLNAICEYLDYFDTTVLSPVIDSIANRIYNDFALEPDSNQMFPEQALFWTCDTLNVNTPVGRIPALKTFITNRRNYVLNELASLPFTCTNSLSDPPDSGFDMEVYPNPFSTQTTLQTEWFLKDAILTVYNLYGQEVKQIKNISGQTILLSRDDLAGGLYFALLTQNNRVMGAEKILITN